MPPASPETSRQSHSQQPTSSFLRADLVFSFGLLIVVAVPWITYWQYGFVGSIGGIVFSQVLYVAILKPQGICMGMAWILTALNSLILLVFALGVLVASWIFWFRTEPLWKVSFMLQSLSCLLSVRTHRHNLWFQNCPLTARGLPNLMNQNPISRTAAVVIEKALWHSNLLDGKQ